jgi:hypothetical protein
MSSLENAIVDKLQTSGPCFLDDVVTYLSNSSWGEVFLAVDRMSRDGRLSLLQVGYSTYQITLKGVAQRHLPRNIPPHSDHQRVGIAG